MSRTARIYHLIRNLEMNKMKLREEILHDVIVSSSNHIKWILTSNYVFAPTPDSGLGKDPDQETGRRLWRVRLWAGQRSRLFRNEPGSALRKRTNRSRSSADRHGWNPENDGAGPEGESQPSSGHRVPTLDPTGTEILLASNCVQPCSGKN